MGAKVIAVADKNETAYYTLPGSSGDLNYEGGSADTTTFGQKYKSSQSTLIGWTGSANAYIKGNAGYLAKFYKVGSSTSMTSVNMVLDYVEPDGDVVYRTEDGLFSYWDNGTTATFADDVGSLTAKSIDYQYGRVTFDVGTSITGTVKVTGARFQMYAIGSARDFTLTMSTEAIETTSYSIAQSNDGFKTYIPGLKTVSVEASGFFDTNNEFKTLVTNRNILVISINPDGVGHSVARGTFIPISTGQSGDVGGNEDETISFELNVQDGVTPFSWNHASGGKISEAIKTVFSAFLADEQIYFKYLHDGTNGWSGPAVLTDCSLSSSIEGVNEISISVTGNGALTVEPQV